MTYLIGLRGIEYRKAIESSMWPPDPEMDMPTTVWYVYDDLGSVRKRAPWGC